MSNSLSKLANVVTILSFPFSTWTVFACLLLTVAYLSLDQWTRLVCAHSVSKWIGRLDAAAERLEWEIVAPNEHLLGEEQCKDVKDMMSR
jgi:hypothetical protein